MSGRWIALALIALSAVETANAQGTDPIPRCGGHFQTCGYADKASGTLLISEQFEVARPFSEGLAAVRVNGLYGYVDKSGKQVIAPRFINAGPFLGDYAEVRVQGASGIIDRSGRLVVAARFRRIIPFSGDSFIAEPLQPGEKQTPDQDMQLDSFDDIVPMPWLGSAGLYHLRKGWLTEQNLAFQHFDRTQRGLIWAARKTGRYDEIWGLLQADGAWRVSPRYGHVQALADTRAVVRSAPDPNLPPEARQAAILSGAVDRDGKLAVPLKFQFLSYWRAGYGLAREGKPYDARGKPQASGTGLVRGDGSLLGQRYFDEVDLREDGHLPRVRIGKDWHSITPDGRLVPDQLEGSPLVTCPGGVSIINRGEAVEFRRSDGASIGHFDNGWYRQKDCGAPIAAKQGSRWFVVLEDGTILGGPDGFDNLYGFIGQHGAVQLGGKWGVIDRSGAFTVRPRYDTLQPRGPDIYTASQAGKNTWIDSSGKEIEQPKATLAQRAQRLICPGGLRFVEKDGLWGLEDETGRSVISPRFRALSCFAQGVSWTAAPGASGWCPIGPDGARLAHLACRKSVYPHGITHHTPEQFSTDPFENSVLWTRALQAYHSGKRAEPPKWIPTFGNGGTYSTSPAPMLGDPVPGT
ncbi:WG repeat-containing protein [Sphingomonas sp. NIBR02145]|uniref:WG repeat-containing protein n=1 Tax=Sphingomonas sp. NIBR02145 TaxID=3014784 RepID=UPI0022B4F02D|nr:WG repeat-containing protein [Sphingomonas sp. NIBR02145]WHU04286.1 WG repeat-containing protein [Sphingomonas sp. NIBR02145]